MMVSAQVSCKHDPDNFCYVRGVFLNVKYVKYTIVEGNLLCSAYKAYFGVQVGNQNKSWVPTWFAEAVSPLWSRGTEGRNES